MFDLIELKFKEKGQQVAWEDLDVMYSVFRKDLSQAIEQIRDLFNVLKSAGT